MKKLLAFMLSVMMVLCMMPSMAFATGTEPSEGGSGPKDLSDATIILSTTETEYTGAVVNSSVTVKLGDDIISPTAYTISYLKGEDYDEDGNGKDVGIYKVKVTAKGDSGYTGEATSNDIFTIKKKDISKVTLIHPNTFIAGKPLTDSSIKIEMKNGSETLTKDTDYTLSFTDTNQTEIKVGSQSLTVNATETGNYAGAFQITVNGGADITSYTVEVDSVTYDGTPKKPTVRVKASGTSAALSSSYYDVTYQNNVNVQDRSKVIITGKNGYAGTIEKTFSISPRDIKYATIAAIDNHTSAQPYAEPVVTDGTKTLKKDTDYRLSYDNTYNAGVETVHITGISNYTGEVTKTYQVKKPLDASAFTILKESYEYTGSNIKPEVLVTSASKYREGVDYKIADIDNSKVGSYTAKIVGIGDYGGVAKTFTYSIIAKSISSTDTTVTLPESVSYDGKKAEPAVTVKTAGRTLVKDVDYTVSYYNNDKIGTATVFIYGKGNYTGSVTKTFKILGKGIETASVTLSAYSYSYTGLEHKPTVTVYDGTKRLTSGIDYTVEYKNNKNCGTASVIITGKGSYSGSKTVTFDIVGKDQTIKTNYTYYTKYLTSSDFNLGAKTDGDGTLTYASSDPKVASVSAKGVVTINGTGIAYITVSSKDDVKYNPAQKVVTVTVKPLKPSIKVTSPAKKQIKVQITKVKGATKYQVRYGRMGKYYNKYITHVDNGYDTVSTTIGKRTSGKNYFIKVRAYKTLDDGTKVWGNWTTIRKIKSK